MISTNFSIKILFFSARTHKFHEQPMRVDYDTWYHIDLAIKVIISIYPDIVIHELVNSIYRHCNVDISKGFILGSQNSLVCAIQQSCLFGIKILNFTINVNKKPVFE